MALEIAISVLFSGIAFGVVLYLISVGLSVTMGLLNVANMAHGAFAVAGGYLTHTFVLRFQLHFFVALLLATAAVVLVSVVLERVLIVRVYDADPLEQVLLTIGIIFVSVAGLHAGYGPVPTIVEIPTLLRGEVRALGLSFSVYRIFLIVFGIFVFLALWLGIERTSLGARIRAAVDNRPMAEATGMNTRRLFTLVFALGSGLAAMGGALGADVIALTPGYPLEWLSYFLIVVVVGGVGTIKGSFAAAMLLGIGDSACRALIPDVGAFFIYATVFIVLLMRPEGIFGRA